MIKTFFKHNFVTLFAAVIAVFAVLLSCIAFSNRVDYSDILDNGIETEAEVLINTYRSNLIVNDVAYYKVDFEFVDENGHKHIGTTSETFTYYEITQICDSGVITIKYDPETFDAVEASYAPSKDFGKTVTTVLAIVFYCVDAILWFFVFKVGINNIKNKKLAETGREYTAKVTHISTNFTVNGVPKYKVHYTWVGENCTTMSGTSASTYLLHEAEALEKAGTIQIKAEGKRSVIVTTPDMCIHNHYNNVSSEDAEQQRQEQLRCDYCGHNISSTDDYCSNCGAKVNIYE